MNVPIIGQSPHKQEMTCEKCGNTYGAPIPQLTVVNEKMFSAIVWSRGPELVKCICGQEYQAVIAGLNPQAIQFATVAVPSPPSSSLIISN